MTTERIASLVLAAAVFFAAPALASAQHEPMQVEHVAPAHRAHGVRLADESERLAPPSAGEYVLPILGIVVGGALVVGGAFALLGSALVAIGDDLSERHSDTAAVLLGVGLGGIAVGAISIIASAVGLVSLRHRQQASESQVNLAGVALAPIDGGALATAWGTF
jgi:hypothetical protein